MRRFAVLFSAVAVLVMMAAPAGATLPYWDLTGTYAIDFTCTSACTGVYPHTMTVSIVDVFSNPGTFSGTGVYDNNAAYTWVVTGTVSGSDLAFNVDYDGTSPDPNYVLNAVGVVELDGSLSGTASSNTGHTFSWESTSGAAVHAFRSTNDNNRTLGHPHVNQLADGFSGFFSPVDNAAPNSAKAGQTIPVKWQLTDPGSVTLEFVNPTNSLAFFEYRIDGVTVGTDPHPVVLGDVIYPGVCVDGRANPVCPAGPVVQTFTASEKVEVRLALGGERDWDFNWVTFLPGDEQPISDPASFVSISSQPGAGTCVGGLPPDAIEEYAGSSGLQYLGDGYWQFNWKTPKSYAGQCRTMVLTLLDGSTHTATGHVRQGGVTPQRHPDHQLAATNSPLTSSTASPAITSSRALASDSGLM